MLRWIGVEPRAFRALLKASVWMDLRSQHYRRATRAGDSRLLPPLVWVLAQNLFISAICAAVLFGRVDAFTYAMLNVGVSMLLLASAVVVEFHEVVLNPEDAEVLAHLPVTPRTYAAVRLTNLFAYVAVIGASLNLCPAAVGVWLPDAGLLFAPAYVVAAAAADVAAAAATIIGYIAFARVIGHARVKDALAYAQIAVTLVAVYGIQLLRIGAGAETERFLEHPPAWLAWTPPAWFASAVEAMSLGLPREHVVQAALGGASAIALAWFGLWFLSEQYARVRSGGAVLGGAGRRHTEFAAASAWADRVWSALCRSREEAAAARFCWIMICRDHDFRMRSIPSAGAALGFFLIGALIGQLVDPFGAAEAGKDAATSIVIPYFVVMAVPIVANNMLFSREHQAAWLFHLAPIRSPAAVVWGASQVIQFAIVLPVFLLLFVGFSIAWRSPLHAAIHCGSGLLVCHITLRWTAVSLLGDWPFSRKYVPGAVAGRTTLFVSFVMGAATVVGIAQSHAYRSVPTLLCFLGALAAVTILISLWATRRVAARGMSDEFP